MFELERLGCPVSFKAVEGSGLLEGYASTFNNIDEGGDVVLPGAFKKTIKERIPAGRVKLLSGHRWEPEATLGTVREAVEDERGLRFRAEFSSAPSVQDIRIKLLEGHLDRLSIGYRAIDWSYKEADGQTLRFLSEIALYEISVVPFPMNAEATVTGVKSVVPFEDLPLGDRELEWDADAAEGRVREWSESEDEATAKYRRAFIWYDQDDAMNFGAYKLLIADVIDGELVAVPAAIFAAAEAMQEDARDGDVIPEGDIDAVKSHLARYYNKMRREWDDETIIPPWSDSAGRRRRAGPGKPPTLWMAKARILQLETQIKGGF